MSLEHSISTVAGALCFSFDTKCVAFSTALSWISDNNSISPRNIQFFTDSMSLVTALHSNTATSKNPHIREIRNLLGNTQINDNITLTWIPAHCGFDGNEEADHLAKIGSEQYHASDITTKEAFKSLIKHNIKFNPTHVRAIETYTCRCGPKQSSNPGLGKGVSSTSN